MQIVDEIAVGDRVVSLVTHNAEYGMKMAKAGMCGTVVKIWTSRLDPNKLLPSYPFDVIWDGFPADDIYPMSGHEFSKLDS
jgi:hypothetical protein